MIRVLYVCMGNICRSPALAAVLQDLVHKQGLDSEFFIDSSALTSFYLGCQVDERTRRAGLRRGIVIEHIAKLFQESDFQKFDYIFAADKEILSILKNIAPLKRKVKILLTTAYSEHFKNEEILDPYYAEENSFDQVMEIAEDSCKGFLKFIL